MNKRVWSIAVALVMLLSMVCSFFIVSAADDVLQIALSSESVSEGDALEATVQLNNYASDWNDLAIRLEYDPSMLEIVSVDTSGFGADGSYTEEQAGILEAKWSYEEAVVKEETAFDAMKISFKVIGTEGASTMKAALQAGEITAEAQAEFEIVKVIEISQEASLLGAEETDDPVPSLKITANQTDVGVNGKIIVDISLENYAGGWASFGAELDYDDTKFEFAGFENKLDLSLLGANVSEDDQLIVNAEDGKLTAYWLRLDGENIPVGEDSIPLLQVSFKAIAEGEQVNFATRFVVDSVAGYPEEDESGKSVMITPGSGYVAEDAVLENPIKIEKKNPYLTMRLADGSTLSTVKRGQKVKAIVRLNDFYEPWMVMSLLLRYNAAIFEIADPENDIKNLDAFPGAMAYEERSDDEENPMAIRFTNDDKDHLLNGTDVFAADILEVTLTALSDATLGETVVSSAFMPEGNFSKTINEANNVEDLEAPLTSDYYIEESTENVTITIERQPYLTLSLPEDQSKEIHQGDEFIVNVNIHKFTQGWTVLSLLADFDTTFFEVIEKEDGNPKVVNTGLFPGELIAVVRDEAPALGMTLLSTTGKDIKLANNATEGTILQMYLRAKEDIPLTKTDFPITVSFAPGGNISQEINGSTPLTSEHYQETVEEELVMEVQGVPSLTIQLAEGQNATINQGETVTFDVLIDDFTGKWSTLSIMAQFDYTVFTMDTDKDGVIDEDLVVDAEPFVNESSNKIEPMLITEFREQSYPFTACWFNGMDLGMKASSQKIMTFTLIARENVDLETAEQAVNLAFIPGGNVTNGNVLEETDYVQKSESVTITVNEIDPEVLVHIAWGDMAFSYSQGTWNVDEHRWKGGGWSCDTDANKITVTNQGGTDISAAFDFIVGSGMDGLDGAFYYDNGEIESVFVANSSEGSQPKDVYFMPSKLPADTTQLGEAATALGTVKITIDIAA